MSKSLAILVVAAGCGERFGASLPKQYTLLGGKPLVQHALERFAAYLPDAQRILVIHPQHYDYLSHCQLPEPTQIIEGGATRQASVKAGLAAIDAYCEFVFVHDAARPFVSERICRELLAGLQHATAIVPVLPVVDTLKQVDNQRVTGTVPREHLRRVQTPQAFHVALLREAHEQMIDVTDDSALCEAMSVTVETIAGDESLFKITTQDDLRRAEAMLVKQTRVGFGYDVHRLELSTNGIIRLGGIDIAHTHRLRGHSDADVVLHALTDAILGACAQGDIGQHFPPNDNSFSGMDSAHFLDHALTLLANEGGKLIHADITIIGEKPKISPYRDEMREKLALLCATDIRNISVKATTTEKLGFEGRGEGLAVHAIVTVTLPKTVL